jgi:hypothetical protein
MNMKNIFNIINKSSIALLFLVLLTVACHKKEEELSLPRQFSPSEINTVNGETSVTISWSASLFTTQGQVSYNVEIADDSTFQNIVYTVTSAKDTIEVTDDVLAIKKDYFVRVQAVGADGRKDSNWLEKLSAFRITGEQFLNAVTTENLIDVAVRLTWRQSNELTKIILTPNNGGNAIEVDLTADELTAQLVQVDNLTSGTTYTAEIFAGEKSKGTIQFTTVAAIAGNVIDLRDINNPTVLIDTLPDIAAGSIVLLKRGNVYTLTSVYNFSQSVTVQSGLDFGTDLARISITSNFNVVAGSAIDSIVFKDLIIRGGNPGFNGSYGSNYFFNANNAATIGTIRLENCRIETLRGVVRAQAGGAGVIIGNYVVNNCVMDTIREYGIAATSGASVIQNIKVTNSTMYKMRKFIALGVTGNQSITISNCTLNELPAGAATAANYVIALGSSSNTSVNGITINNTVIGNPWNETGAGPAIYGLQASASTAVTANNSYNTSDFASAVADHPIAGLVGYSGTTAQLFTDPANGNFKFLDGNFIGKGSAGDPRWR